MAPGPDLKAGSEGPTFISGTAWRLQKKRVLLDTRQVGALELVVGEQAESDELEAVAPSLGMMFVYSSSKRILPVLTLVKDRSSVSQRSFIDRSGGTMC
jgi:hypothetical protein